MLVYLTTYLFIPTNINKYVHNYSSVIYIYVKSKKNISKIWFVMNVAEVKFVPYIKLYEAWHKFIHKLYFSLYKTHTLLLR